MFKSLHREIEVIHKIGDLLIVLISWCAAYFLRFKTIIPDAQIGLELWYVKALIILFFLSYYFFKKEELYSSKRLESLLREAVGVVRANVFAFTVFVLVIYFLSPHKASRVFLLTYLLFSTCLLLIFKFFIRKILRSFRKRGRNIRYAILVGSGSQIEAYLEKILLHPEVGVKILGWVDSEGRAEQLKIENIPSLTEKTLKDYSLDLVIIGYLNKDYHKVDKIFKTVLNSSVEALVLPDLSYSLVGYNILEFHRIPVIMINQPNIQSRSVILKRSLDVFLSLFVLILLFPFFILIAFLVKRSSAGPVFYSQDRMGLDGKNFKMWKFRTMTAHSSNHEGWTIKDDPRVTKIGKILRKTSLDELPQFWNVLIGEMSLVGPRPERPKYVEKFREEIPAYMLRHKMKAGITGWAQINGWRGDTSIEKRIECDLYYIRNWSFWMDLSILIMTPWKGFFHRNAY